MNPDPFKSSVLIGFEAFGLLGVWVALPFWV